MRAMLINPPKRHQVWAGVPDIFNGRDAYLFPPLGIMTLAAFIHSRSAHEVLLLDCLPQDLSYAELADRIRAAQPRLVGITAHTHNLVDVHKTALLVKRIDPSIHVVLGGGHVWAFPEAAAGLSGVDSAVRGDGEFTLLELLEALEAGRTLAGIQGLLYQDARGQVVRNPDRPLLHPLDDLPYPDRKSLGLETYFTPAMRRRRATTMITSRGCPNRCTFCSTYKTYRTRSPRDIVKEIQHCVAEYGIEEIHFVDDIFNQSPQRVIDICQAILDEGVKVEWGMKTSCATTTPEMLAAAKAAGCTKIHLGVETGTDEGLRALNKNIDTGIIRQAFKWTREAGITSIAYMMIGCPHEKNREDIYRTVNFMREVDPDYIVYALMTPYPDTTLYQTGLERGLYSPQPWADFLKNPVEDHDLPTVWEEYMSKAELLDIFKDVHRDFYLDPRIIWRTFRKVKTWEEFKRLTLGGLSVLKLQLMRTGRRI